jgi:hypothetical protein
MIRMARAIAVGVILASAGPGACTVAGPDPRVRDAPTERERDSDQGATAAVLPGSGTPPDRAAPVPPGDLASVVAEPVINWLGPGGQPFEVQVRTRQPLPANTRRFGAITLRNSARERAPDLSQYPCRSCHMGRRTVLRDQRVEDAHRNIQPVHPAQTGATCGTCHASDDVELLALRTGERATLDHAYRLCAQCHFQQAESWAGGAHGKRLDGWQGRRVVMGCADCHDPHRPAVEPRIPFRPPKLHRPPVRP